MPLYKLFDGASSVDIDPTRGLNIPETRIRQHIEGKDKPDDHEWGNAAKYEIPLINLTKARADQLLAWWTDMEPLTFTPDQASPGDTIQMIIDGVERPLNMWHHKFDSKYAGNLVLCEVSSQSFSDSQISVSQSKSCSAFDASESCSPSLSRSCSVFLTSVSDSQSEGTESVAVPSYSTFRSCSIFSTSDLFVSCSLSSVLFESDYFTTSSCVTASSVGENSSCEDLSSRSDSFSDSLSTGTIGVSFTDSSCEDLPTESCSESAAGESCSNSAGGIS